MRILLLLLSMIFFLTGCTDLYLPASMGATTQPVYIAPKIAPPSNSFLAVEYNKALTWGEGDTNSLTKFNFARNITYKFLLLQFDATVFQGQYTVASVPGYLVLRQALNDVSKV